MGAWLNELNESWDEGVLYSEVNRGYAWSTGHHPLSV